MSLDNRPRFRKSSLREGMGRGKPTMSITSRSNSTFDLRLQLDLQTIAIAPKNTTQRYNGGWPVQSGLITHRKVLPRGSNETLGSLLRPLGRFTVGEENERWVENKAYYESLYNHARSPIAEVYPEEVTRRWAVFSGPRDGFNVGESPAQRISPVASVVQSTELESVNHRTTLILGNRWYEEYLDRIKGYFMRKAKEVKKTRKETFQELELETSLLASDGKTSAKPEPARQAPSHGNTYSQAPLTKTSRPEHPKAPSGLEKV